MVCVICWKKAEKYITFEENIRNSKAAMEKFISQPIHFISNGLRCTGKLYLPHQDVTSAYKLPCLILTNGFTGTMDWLVTDYAARFAAEGMEVLIFEYRYFGQSEGGPNRNGQY